MPVHVDTLVDVLREARHQPVAPIASDEHNAALCYKAASRIVSGDEPLMFATASRAAAFLRLCSETPQEPLLVGRDAIVVAATIDHQFFEPFEADWFLLVVSNAQCVLEQPPWAPCGNEKKFDSKATDCQLEWRGNDGAVSRDYISIRTPSAVLPFITLRVVRVRRDGTTWGFLLRQHNFLSAALRSGTVHRAAVIVEVPEGDRAPGRQMVRLAGQQRLYVEYA